MKMNQIAFYCQTEWSERHVKELFGLHNADWVRDTVVSTNIIHPEHLPSYETQAVGELQFNYDLGIELEILRYVSGASWHHHLPLKYAIKGSLIPFISHVGIHLEDGENFPDDDYILESCWRLVQETKTKAHTNPYVLEKKRTYEYRIYESMQGTYIKYIKRINHA